MELASRKNSSFSYPKHLHSFSLEKSRRGLSTGRKGGTPDWKTRHLATYFLSGRKWWSESSPKPARKETGRRCYNRSRQRSVPARRKQSVRKVIQKTDVQLVVCVHLDTCAAAHTTNFLFVQSSAIVALLCLAEHQELQHLLCSSPRKWHQS